MAHMGWNDEIKNDGGDFKLLEPGTYPFVIKRVEKSFVSSSSRYSGAPMAVVTLRVGTGANATDVIDRIILDTDLEWKHCQFFNGIGVRKHGETFAMNWDEGFLVGKAGFVEIGHREYTKDGETRKANQVEKYIDPADMAAANAAMATVTPATGGEQVAGW